LTAYKVNLGSGQFKKQGFLNIDFDPFTNPDVLHDLNVFPYPLEDDSCELIEADHVLEHVHDAFAVMKEVHRLLKKGGALVVRVPHFSRGFSHADHKHGFDVTFPYYFKPDFKGGYSGVHFVHTSSRLHWFSQMELKKTVLSPILLYPAAFLGRILDFLANLSPFLCSRIWCYWVGGFEEIEFRFTSSKK
jgi:SAM-dependent methyltransferase